MYRAFNIKNVTFKSEYSHLLRLYNQTHVNDCKEIRNNIKDFILSNNDIDGSALQDAFFPIDLYPDVFISHSHDDEDFAKAFAQYLYNKFKITSFIDSTVWGGFTELQNTLDNYFIETNGIRYTRDDQYRVISHVHLMLNTPQSVSVDDLIGDSTYSPWIFSEIGMYHLIEKHEHPRRVQESYFSAGRIKQRLNLTDFTEITVNDLNTWSEKYQDGKGLFFTQGVTALDVLYEMKPLKNNIKRM